MNLQKIQTIKNTSQSEILFIVDIDQKEQLTKCQVGFRSHKPRPIIIKIPGVQNVSKFLLEQ